MGVGQSQWIRVSEPDTHLAYTSIRSWGGEGGDSRSEYQNLILQRDTEYQDLISFPKVNLLYIILFISTHNILVMGDILSIQLILLIRNLYWFPDLEKNNIIPHIER